MGAKWDLLVEWKRRRKKKMEVALRVGLCNEWIWTGIGARENGQWLVKNQSIMEYGMNEEGRG